MDLQLIVFIRRSNNCSTTVLDVFYKGEQLFGSPNCVCGRENVEVWRHMIEANKQIRSTHNERVERMW